MTWKLTGETCCEAGCNKPVFETHRCRPHFDLAWAFGYAGEEPEIVVLDHQSSAFLRELNAWREAA